MLEYKRSVTFGFVSVDKEESYALLFYLQSWPLLNFIKLHLYFTICFSEAKIFDSQNHLSGILLVRSLFFNVVLKQN